MVMLNFSKFYFGVNDSRLNIFLFRLSKSFIKGFPT